MKKLTDLKILFTVAAVMEFFYFIICMLPPSIIPSLVGWNLNVDGFWLTKILGLSLGTMGYIAWIFRKDPHIGIAKGLAFYQIASATADWVMWLTFKEEGIFGSSIAQFSVVGAIFSHYLLGILLVIAINKVGKNG